MKTTMQLVHGWFIALLAVGTFLTLNSAHAATVYNLRSDWSDGANPNGVWTYRAGSQVLTHIADWPLAAFGYTQPAWGANLPAWFKSTGAPNNPYDWQPGDIVVHSQDEFNGVGNGLANVTWTSPANGVFDISGAVWMGRDIDRGNQWNLYVRGTNASSGTIVSGDAYSRTNPFSFSLGSGGSTALRNVSIAIGDVITLEIVRTSAAGDFVGVELVISEQARVDLLATIRVSCVDICWPGRTNKLYQVQYSSSLTTNSWVNFGSPVQGTGTNCVTDAVRNMEHRFYRVIDSP